MSSKLERNKEETLLKQTNHHFQLQLITTQASGMALSIHTKSVSSSTTLVQTEISEQNVDGFHDILYRLGSPWFLEDETN